MRPCRWDLLLSPQIQSHYHSLDWYLKNNNVYHIIQQLNNKKDNSWNSWTYLCNTLFYVKEHINGHKNVFLPEHNGFPFVLCNCSSSKSVYRIILSPFITCFVHLLNRFDPPSPPHYLRSLVSLINSHTNQVEVFSLTFISSTDSSEGPNQNEQCSIYSIHGCDSAKWNEKKELN